jgi:hypothetical protein
MTTLSFHSQSNLNSMPQSPLSPYCSKTSGNHVRFDLTRNSEFQYASNKTLKNIFQGVLTIWKNYSLQEAKDDSEPCLSNGVPRPILTSLPATIDSKEFLQHYENEAQAYVHRFESDGESVADSDLSSSYSSNSSTCPTCAPFIECNRNCNDTERSIKSILKPAATHKTIVEAPPSQVLITRKRNNKKNKSKRK